MKFKIAVLSATGYIGSPYRREIRDCPEDATIVSLCGRQLELLEAALLSTDVAMPFTWRDDATISSAGSIADVGSHAYDAVRWVSGGEAKRVLTHADVISPAKSDLGSINLEETIACGAENMSSDTTQTRKGSAYDYASISIEVNSGAVGTMVLSHAPFLRKGMTPELELHGTEASLSIDRISGAVRLFRSDVNGRIEGLPSVHPGLDDGYRVQLFTEAAARSARQRICVDVSDLENELSVQSISAGSIR